MRQEPFFMAATTNICKCHACGAKMEADAAACPRCRVSRRGDVNKPMFAAYSFFLLLMLVGGMGAILYLRSLGIH